MIKGEQRKEIYITDKPVVNYRKIAALNQSMIALFDSEPVAFFEQFKLGRPKKRKPNISMDIGNLVDFFILECRANLEEFENRFDEQFALIDTKGGGQVFELADILFDITEKSLDEKGQSTSSFLTRFEAALAEIQQGKTPKYKGKTVEKALEDFDTNGKEYFQKRLDNIGKTVVPTSLVEKAKVVAYGLLKDEFTSDVFEEEHEEGIEKLTKFPIEWIYTTQSGKKILCKSEVDIIHIDHENKRIYPKDLKTTFDNESFEYSYIKNNYYLQAAFYYMAVAHWGVKSGLIDYDIMPMEFIVGDTSANNRRPIRYQLDTNDINNGANGFYMRGTYYKGINELIEEISWAEDNDIWNCSKQVFDNKGIMQLSIKYD